MAKNKRNRNTLSDNAEYDAIINALKEINKSALSEQKYYDNQPQKEMLFCATLVYVKSI